MKPEKIVITQKLKGQIWHILWKSARWMTHGIVSMSELKIKIPDKIRIKGWGKKNKPL